MRMGDEPKSSLDGAFDLLGDATLLEGAEFAAWFKSHRLDLVRLRTTVEQLFEMGEQAGLNPRVVGAAEKGGVKSVGGAVPAGIPKSRACLRSGRRKAPSEKIVTVLRRCASCGSDLTGRRYQAKTCSAKCRQRASRDRRGLRPKPVGIVILRPRARKPA